MKADNVYCLVTELPSYRIFVAIGSKACSKMIKIAAEETSEPNVQAAHMLVVLVKMFQLQS